MEQVKGKGKALALMWLAQWKGKGKGDTAQSSKGGKDSKTPAAGTVLGKGKKSVESGPLRKLKRLRKMKTSELPALPALEDAPQPAALKRKKSAQQVEENEAKAAKKCGLKRGKSATKVKVEEAEEKEEDAEMEGTPEEEGEGAEADEPEDDAGEDEPGDAGDDEPEDAGDDEPGDADKEEGDEENAEAEATEPAAAGSKPTKKKKKLTGVVSAQGEPIVRLRAKTSCDSFKTPDRPTSKSKKTKSEDKSEEKPELKPKAAFLVCIILYVFSFCVLLLFLSPFDSCSMSSVRDADRGLPRDRIRAEA